MVVTRTTRQKKWRIRTANGRDNDEQAADRKEPWLLRTKEDRARLEKDRAKRRSLADR